MHGGLPPRRGSVFSSRLNLSPEVIIKLLLIPPVIGAFAGAWYAALYAWSITLWFAFDHPTLWWICTGMGITIAAQFIAGLVAYARAPAAVAAAAAQDNTAAPAPLPIDRAA